MNKKQLLNLIELDKKIQKQSDKILPEIYAKAKQIFDFRKMGDNWCNFPKTHSRLVNEQDRESDSIVITKKSIIIYWSEYHCDSDDYYNISFPFDYLFMSDKEWKKIEIDERKKKEKQLSKEKEERKITQDRKWKEMDTKEYKRLKKKLGL